MTSMQSQTNCTDDLCNAHKSFEQLLNPSCTCAFNCHRLAYIGCNWVCFAHGCMYVTLLLVATSSASKAASPEAGMHPKPIPYLDLGLQLSVPCCTPTSCRWGFSSRSRACKAEEVSAQAMLHCGHHRSGQNHLLRRHTRPVARLRRARNRHRLAKAVRHGVPAGPSSTTAGATGLCIIRDPTPLQSLPLLTAKTSRHEEPKQQPYSAQYAD